MVDTYHVTVDSVEPVPGLGADQGWVGMTVQFLIDAAKAGSQHFVFGRARFAPGPSRHEWHRHPGAEEFVLLARGEGVVLDGDNEIPVKVGDIVFHRKGEWHGFRNTSDTEEAELIWGWGGATSKAEAGYELRYHHSRSEDHETSDQNDRNPIVHTEQVGN
jgi:quercetin dioxygenase-like cupin family protein